MRLLKLWSKAGLVLVCFAAAFVSAQQETASGYLQWSEKEAESIGERMRKSGRVGGWFDTRIRHTERSYNYKLRATWLTPEVIRASARIVQVKNWLTDDETEALVAEAEAAGQTVILVEIDPREGSGVVPRGWLSLLKPKETSDGSTGVRGQNTPELRKLKALAGVMPRDYDYDAFWVVFPLVNREGEPLFSEETREAELVVRIYYKEGRVHWPVPDSIRERSRRIAASEGAER